MSDRTNNRENDPLKDLFGRKNDAGRDDFEREALEGFYMLNNEDEAFEAKKKLDERIDKEVFGKKEKNRKPVYWLAAAALLLIVGFSVFVLNENDRREEAKLAIHKVETKKPEPQKPEPVAAEQASPDASEKKSEEPKKSQNDPGRASAAGLSQPMNHAAKGEGAGGPALAVAKEKQTKNAAAQMEESEVN